MSRIRNIQNSFPKNMGNVKRKCELFFMCTAVKLSYTDKSAISQIVSHLGICSTTDYILNNAVFSSSNCQILSVTKAGNKLWIWFCQSIINKVLTFCQHSQDTFTKTNIADQKRILLELQ